MGKKRRQGGSGARVDAPQGKKKVLLAAANGAEAGAPQGEGASGEELSLGEIHEVQLSILRWLCEISKKERIRFFPAYGTLLGAVRHKGFIPWDDDMDVWMPREDYERLSAYFEREGDALLPYRLMRPGEGLYPHCIARICDTDYPIEVDNEAPCGMGVFIDVYPLDGFGDDPNPHRGKSRRLRHLVLGVSYASRLSFPMPGSFLRVPDRYLYYRWARRKGRDYFLKKIERFRGNVPWRESRFVGCSDQDDYIYRRAWFDKTVPGEFCGMRVKLPAGYDEILKTRYKDYMQLPPEEKRSPQHDYRAYRKARGEDGGPEREAGRDKG